MKTLLASVVSLLFVVVSFSLAQDPVPLETWTVIKGWNDPKWNDNYGVGRQLSFLPNFRNGHGKHAVLINYFDKGGYATHDQTWYLETPTDTLSRFDWPAGMSSGTRQLDINGDNFVDYLSSNGYLYLGIADGVPDTSRYYQVPSLPDGYAGSSKNTYGDYNADRKDDVLYLHEAGVNSPNLLTIIFGGEDVGALQRVSPQSPAVAEDTTLNEQAAVLYQNKQGAWRLLSYVYGYQYKEVNHQQRWLPDPFKAAIRLYSVRFEGTKITLEKIDEYRAPEWKNFNYTELAFQPFEKDQTFLFQSVKHPKIVAYLMFSRIDNQKNIITLSPIVDLTGDRISVSNLDGSAAFTPSDGVLLEHSVDGDSLEDIAVMRVNTVEIHCLTAETTYPRMCMRYRDANLGLTGDVYSVGDVSGDGISDISAIFRNDVKGNTFAIIKGRDWRSTGVIDEPKNIGLSLNIGAPYPIPTQSDMIAIPIITDGTDAYTLSVFSLDGRHFTDVYNGMLEAGQYTLPLNTARFTAGTYLLRLSGGKKSVQRTLIIGK
jgi:hypothetical protein